MSSIRSFLAAALVLSIGAIGYVTAAERDDHQTHVTSVFKGAKVNGGTVTHSKENGQNVFIWSDDFVIPGTPAPHWQVVDSSGNTYLLQRLKVKGDKENKRIVLPSYIKDVAKVQIWCAYAEVLLGEASFEKPVS